MPRSLLALFLASCLFACSGVAGLGGASEKAGGAAESGGEKTAKERTRAPVDDEDQPADTPKQVSGAFLACGVAQGERVAGAHGCGFFDESGEPGATQPRITKVELRTSETSALVGTTLETPAAGSKWRVVFGLAADVAASLTAYVVTHETGGVSTRSVVEAGASTEAKSERLTLDFAKLRGDDAIFDFVSCLNMATGSRALAGHAACATRCVERDFLVGGMIGCSAGPSEAPEDDTFACLCAGRDAEDVKTIVAPVAELAADVPGAPSACGGLFPPLTATRSWEGAIRRHCDALCRADGHVGGFDMGCNPTIESLDCACLVKGASRFDVELADLDAEARGPATCAEFAEGRWVSSADAGCTSACDAKGSAGGFMTACEGGTATCLCGP